MRTFRMIWASAAGWMVDYFLTMLIVPLGYAALDISTISDIQLNNPLHIVVALILPALMTTIGGGVAGRLSLENPTPAGALVGGWGLLMLFDSPLEQNSFTLAMLITQCVATLGAALAANYIAKRTLQKSSLE
ncbi:MAG TPA: hypothetical protein DEF47_05665 [Herpetosiphon sp.]|uniref:Uncharacterized protein n=2 Tax=Herpetosiphon TaxID=64 RepID=A9B509_HERA2|nr:hypothetical protein [Herpetosiphon sp.]ABX05732.1 hypothetical protein Haur_3094 [Herpetosiphon aurantiacus DSM 785]MCA0352883.1 hypothetical protein [Chloroflexota bacterium]HBW49369.1 hypothetical protein [Herpetosiphon sp.]